MNMNDKIAETDTREPWEMLPEDAYYHAPPPMAMLVAVVVFVTWSAAMFWFGWAVHG